MAIIGAHVSVAGGLYVGIENAERIGAKSIQIFGSSPRQWSVRIPSKKDIEEYKKHLKNSNVSAVYLHAPYLINLASINDEMLAKSIIALSGHMQITEAINANGLIFHIGSGGKDMSRKDAIKRSIDAIKVVLKKSSGKTQLIMENTAGGGQKLGSNMDELGKIFKAVRSKRLKICIDTAHAYEAGLLDGYTKTNIKKFFNEADKSFGAENIAVIHINDSKTLFNSHHDRHENIGKGYIGLQGFKNLAGEKRINHIPWILEVPGFDSAGPDKKNIKILRSCF